MKNTVLLIYFLFSISLSEAQIPGYEQEKQSSLSSSTNPVKLRSRNFIIAAFDTVRKQLPIEKLYLHTDKSDYSLNDTIWFKAYLFDQAYLTPAKSKLIYVELVSEANVVVKRIVISTTAGLSVGHIQLSDEFIEGNYVLRAYTNWMRNFGEDYIFSKSFTVKQPSGSRWFVEMKTFNFEQKKGMSFKFEDSKKQALSYRELQIQLKDKTKILYEEKLKTGADGQLEFNLPLFNKTSGTGLTLVVEDLKMGDEGYRLQIPLTNTNQIDLQFMPEGGNMLAEYPAHIGFKAIGEDGMGVFVSGEILNNKGSKVVSFSSSKLGIGVFSFIPKLNESYHARLLSEDGTFKNFSLPALKNTGTVMHVVNSLESDSLTIELTASLLMGDNIQSYFLIAQSRGVLCYLAEIKDLTTKKVRIAKSLFPTGVARFTLMNFAEQALNERITFIDHHDNLSINVLEIQSTYNLKEKITFQLNVKDKNGKAVSGSFSSAITDDSFISADTVNSIFSNMFLTSDLKGEIEDPGYYFGDLKDLKRWEALDHLLITQGWVGYEWDQLFDSSLPKYNTEQELLVKGRVVNAFDKPIDGTSVLMSSRDPEFIKHAVTDEDGRFIFNNFPLMDKAALNIQALNKSGRSFNVGVEIDLPTFPNFTNFPLKRNPWFVNSDSVVLQPILNQITQLESKGNLLGGRMLDEVKVTATRIIKGSKNLNGAGMADQILDEKDMELAGKKTLMQLLEEQIIGFKVGSYNLKSKANYQVYDFAHGFIKLPPGHCNIRKECFIQPWFFVKNKPVVLILDGSPITTFHQIYLLIDYQNFFKSVSAEDIKGIEVLSSSKYSEKYIPASMKPYISSAAIAFIEITTHTGNGASMNRVPGNYMHKPLAPFSPRQFYKPKYLTKQTDDTQLRTTIDWEPNINTSSSGKASFSFYTADRPGTYNVIIEGSDMDGNLGRKVFKLHIGVPK